MMHDVLETEAASEQAATHLGVLEANLAANHLRGDEAQRWRVGGPAAHREQPAQHSQETGQPRSAAAARAVAALRSLAREMPHLAELHDAVKVAGDAHAAALGVARQVVKLRRGGWWVVVVCNPSASCTGAAHPPRCSPAGTAGAASPAGPARPAGTTRPAGTAGAARTLSTSMPLRPLATISHSHWQPGGGAPAPPCPDRISDCTRRMSWGRQGPAGTGAATHIRTSQQPLVSLAPWPCKPAKAPRRAARRQAPTAAAAGPYPGASRAGHITQVPGASAHLLAQRVDVVFIHNVFQHAAAHVFVLPGARQGWRQGAEMEAGCPEMEGGRSAASGAQQGQTAGAAVPPQCACAPPSHQSVMPRRRSSSRSKT